MTREIFFQYLPLVMGDPGFGIQVPEETDFRMFLHVCIDEFCGFIGCIFHCINLSC